MNKCFLDTELSSLEETCCEFNRGPRVIKLGIDVHQEFYVVVMQEGGSNPKPPQRFGKGAFLHWAAKLKREGSEVHAVYEACGFGFSLQRQLSALSIQCYVVCPQKLDEANKRVKTDSLDAKALCFGFSKNLKQRLATHHLGKAFATSFRGPWKLIYYEAYLDEADALGREKYLKSGGGRRFLRAQLKHHLSKESRTLSRVSEAA